MNWKEGKAPVKKAEGKVIKKRKVDGGEDEHHHDHDEMRFFSLLQGDDLCLFDVYIILANEFYPKAVQSYAGIDDDLDMEEFESGDDDEGVLEPIEEEEN